MSGSAPRRVLPTLSLAVLAVVPFLPSLRGIWLYDDQPLILENPYVHHLHWIGRWLTTDFWNTTASGTHPFGYWRPLVTASYALDWQLGASPVVFHVTNLLLHAAAAVLVFEVLRRWVGATWPAWIAALLFAIHPTKAESVAWISGRTDVLCAIGMLLASQGIGRRLRGARGGIALEVAGTVIAYLSKEEAVILAAFAFVEAWVALGRPAIELPVVKRAVWTALPQLAVAVGYLAIRMIVLPIGFAVPIPFTDHLLAILETLGWFLALTVAPRNLSMQHAVVHIAQHRMIHDWTYVALGALALVALVGLAAALRRRWPIATVGIGLYLVTLVPVMNLKDTGLAELVSERFLYLPVLGLALIAGAALAAADATWRRRGYALASALAVALAAISASHAADFRGEDAFWQRELQLHPDSDKARRYVLGKALNESHYEAALQILGDMMAANAHYDPDFDSELVVASDAAFALMHLTPDRDVASLRELDAFLEALLDHARPVARLSLRGVQLAVSMDDRGYVKVLEPYAPSLEAFRADLASRLGDDAAALRLAARARKACALCMQSVIADVLAHARAGRYDAALQILDHAAAEVQSPTLDELRERVTQAQHEAQVAASSTGLAQATARAEALGSVYLWGRAYGTLAPHTAEVLASPQLTKELAELAYRAGEPVVARRLLAAVVAPGEIAGYTAAWDEAMGWTAPAPRSASGQP